MHFRVSWPPPVTAHLENNITLYTVPPPGSGVILTLILNILNGMVPNENNITTYQRITEAFKYGYGKRTQLGDPDFVDISEVSTGDSIFSAVYVTIFSFFLMLSEGLSYIKNYIYMYNPMTCKQLLSKEVWNDVYNRVVVDSPLEAFLNTFLRCINP